MRAVRSYLPESLVLYFSRPAASRTPREVGLFCYKLPEFRPACKECISLPHTGERDREGFKGGTVAGLLFLMGWSEQTSLLEGIFELRSVGEWVSHKDL